jgi:hypothetical protein
MSQNQIAVVHRLGEATYPQFALFADELSSC